MDCTPYSAATGLCCSTRSLTIITVVGTFAVAQKQGIMSDAQTNHDVEIAAVRGKRLGLHDRVAHGLVSAAAVELFFSFGTPISVLSCAPTLQPTVKYSMPFALRMRAKMEASRIRPTQDAMPIFL